MMFDKIIGFSTLLKVSLLLIAGIFLIFEPRKKSLRPLGFLLFSVGSSFLIEDVESLNIISSNKIFSLNFDYIDASIVKNC
ncbi:MAG: hypothetical protein F6K40_20410 [Okeania sp. SIO3I5]|uniref:hypothetical protein n=1 Tax=Okeania sp. SIO3I5 TaxID=2607805 RepID=UPI0013B7983A|nr:hypothetical protein [Okeania sp. SIO3I5]NEQ38501.1 hypothetical protein [Okeania sp. SIO3I5]